MEIITRKIDKLGRIVLPIDFRKNLGLMVGADVVMCIENGVITIKKSDVLCKICNSGRSVSKSICICNSCIQKIKKMNHATDESTLAVQ
ncbi:MAG: AbrB/MazE/SpoVT family DNA-binding domain-containing protein [Clostridia bacterium]|nr:AbrB/MazE/SpoVT family DNA-binding domain-containing protein [Clostridia bacterium]